MTENAVLFSLVLGLGIGLLSAITSFWFIRRGIGQDIKRFLTLVLGSMALRFIGVSVMAVLIVMLLPVRKEIFIPAMLLSLLAGIAFDTYRLYSKAKNRIE
ncbi:MAG TPA: hypothetical protein DIW24_06205 [Bacteroidetes bacterium]|nr:hypothetical protein [Bacteroidota bacterium]